MLVPMLAIMGLTLGLVSLVQAYLGAASLAQQQQRQQTRIAHTLSRANFPLDDNVLRQAAALVGAELVVTDAAGRPLAASARPLEEPVSPPRPTAALGGLPGQPSLRWRQATVELDRRSVGGERLTLHLLYDRHAWDQARWQAVGPPLAVGGLGLAMVALAAGLIASHVTRPIRQLQRQVETIAQGRFVPFPLPPRHDEVRELAVAINQLAQRLAEYDQQIRRHERLATVATLGAGLAHQLRNAATGCRMAIDLHRRECPAALADPESPLQVALRQLDHMESTIQRLLVLGRADRSPRQLLDLADVADEALGLVRPLATHWGIVLDARQPNPRPRATGDRLALVHALVELLLNAMQAALQGRTAAASSPGTCQPGPPVVVLQVEQPSPERCQFVVCDPGPGLTPQIAAQLFEPLTTDKPGGTGLGLAAAQRIAQEHGGTLTYVRQADRTCFVLQIAASA
jgi:signal transduction histidine kinase